MFRYRDSAKKAINNEEEREFLKQFSTKIVSTTKAQNREMR